MTNKFKQAIEALEETHKQFQARAVSPLAHSREREVAISNALREMALSMDVKLQEPLQINSRGEYSIVAISEVEESKTYAKCYGKLFSAALNRHNPRTGINPGAILGSQSGWCYLNHFEAEKMVLEHYAATLQQLQEN